MEKSRKQKSAKGSVVGGDLNSAQNSVVEHAKEESPHPSREKNKSRLRRHRGGASDAVVDSPDSGDASNVGKKSQKRRKKKKKKKSSRATTATGTTETSSEWTTRSKSRLPSRERKRDRDDKPKDLSEKDLVQWMKKMVPYVDSQNSPLWNKWTLAPLYHFVRHPETMLCIAFYLNEDIDHLEDEGVLHRLVKVCQGNLITFNRIIPEYRGSLFYFFKTQSVALDGLNHDEVVVFGNVPSADNLLAINNLLVLYWTPIIMDEECLPVGIQNDVFTELNTVLCSTQTATHYSSGESEHELLLYIPPEVSRERGNNKSPDFKLAKNKEFNSRLEETVVYWITKLKQVLVLHDELNDVETWPGPLEEIQFWTSRCKNLKNILAQIYTPGMRHVLRILAISHSPYFFELKSIFEQVSTCHQEASSNSHFLQILRQPLEKLSNCKLSEVRVEMQKVVWLILTIWRNAPYYNTPLRLNTLLRKFSNALIIHCCGKIPVKRIFQGTDIRKAERMLKNCLKCLEWWREIYELTEATHKRRNGDKPWIFDENQIFVHVDALILRIQNLLEICRVQKLYRLESLPLYPGIKGPYIAGVMKICERILSSKLEEMEKISELVLNVKNIEWNDHMNGFRDTVLGIDMSVQNVLELSFEQMPNLKRQVELMHLFQRFYGQREVITRQLDKLCVKLYEHFEEEMLRLRHLFERKVVPLPRTYTKMAGRSTWAVFMKNRIESDLDTLKKAEAWLPKTSGVGFQTLVKNEAKSLAEAMCAFSEKCYKNWAKDFQQVELHSHRENHRGKLEVPLLIRGKGDLVKVNFDRSVYRNLTEAEMWVRMGRSVPPVLLLTIYPWRDKLHGLKENMWVIAKWYNKCVGGLSRDERLLFKDRLLPVEKKIYPCLAQGEFTWTTIKTADQIFLEEFRALTENVLENVREYREATLKITDLIAAISEKRLVKIYSGGRRGKVDRVYDGVDEFKKKQNRRIERELRKVVDGYREIGTILKELFTNLFRYDGVEVKVQWGKYVNLVDGCVEEALKHSVRKSLEILDQAVSGDDREKPFFRVKMVLEGGELRFSPRLEDMAEMVIGVHKNLGKTVEPLVRLGRFLGTGKLAITWEKGGMTGYCEAVLKDEPSLEIQKRIIFAVERCLSEVNLYTERWIPYRDIWEVDREEFMKNYEKQYPNMESYDKDLKKYKEISEIVDGGDSMVTIRWLQVDCTQLKLGIAEESTAWFQLLAGDIYGKGKEGLKTVYNYMEEKRRTLSKEPETLQEQLSLWKLAQTVRGEARQKIFSLFPSIQERFELLRKYSYEIEPEIEEMEINLESAWRKYLRFMKQTDERLEKSRGRLKQAFLDQADILKGKVNELQKIWEMEGPFSKGNGDRSSEQVFMQLENFRNEMKALEQEDVELIEALETFNLKRKKSQVLIDFECDIAYLAQVWKEVENWDNHWNNLKSVKIPGIDVDKINQLADRFLEIFRKLNKEFEVKSWPVINEMIEFIGDVQIAVKCCELLRQQTLQTRHWELIRNLVSKNSSLQGNLLPTFPEDLDLETILQLSLHKLLGSISELKWSSEKEMAVEKTLRKITDFWENETFVLKKQKTSARSQVAFEIQCSPGLQDYLMDHIVSLAAMKGSKFIGIFQENIDFWDESLQNVDEVLGILMETQKEWLLLDGVLSKEHIQRDMPGTTRSFSVVTSVWASVLLIVTQIRYVVRVVNETEDLQDMLQGLQEKMEEIRKDLVVYLQELRQEFPRFYFIPNEKLLECLGGGEREMEDLLEVTKKVFGNFGNMSISKSEEDTGSELMIEGVISKDALEELVLGNPIRIFDTPLEIWLADLEREIRSSVKENLVGCLEKFGNWSKLEDLVLDTSNWTGQSLLTAVKIRWTADMTLAIQGNTDDKPEGLRELSLKNMAKKLKRSISKLVKILSEKERGTGLAKILEGVLVTLIYLKDVTERLHARNCNDLNSFEWLQYLRWYSNSEGCGEYVEARQGFARIPYGWEYCDSGKTTVITPLTERCFLALNTAIGFQMGAVLQGNWNSGKKETINELGSQLGKLVMNVRVNPATDFKHVSSFVSGLVQTGAWGVFVGIDKGQPELVQLLVSKFSLITKAKSASCEKLMLDGMEVKLNQGCGMFAVMSVPFEGESVESTAFIHLKSVMRPVSFMQPDSRNILEVKLFLAGFENSIVLAKKIETIFMTSATNCIENFQDKNRRFLFSLSNMLAATKQAIQLKIRHGKRLSETEAVINALKQLVLPVLIIENEKIIFLDLLKTLFPTEQQPVSLKRDNFHLEHFVRKSISHLGYQNSEKMIQFCLQLYELLQVHRAVVIVGKTGSGKSAIRNVLKAALILMHRYEDEQRLSDDDNSILDREERVSSELERNFIKEHIINPATMEGTVELFGGFTEDGNKKWKDGVVTNILKNHQRHNEAEAEEAWLWLVFDGTLQDYSIPEEIHDLCNKNAIVSLTNCDTVATPEQMTIYFETNTLRKASPGLLSRCGVLYIQSVNDEDHDSIWKLSLKTQMSRLSYSMKSGVDEYLSTALEKCLKFRAENCTSLISNVVTLQLVEMFMTLLNSFLKGDKVNELKEDGTDRFVLLIKQAIAFSIIWSIFTGINEESQQKASVFLKDLSPLQNIFPAKRTVFDYFLDTESQKWIRWENLSESALNTKSINVSDLINGVVETVDVFKAKYLIKRYKTKVALDDQVRPVLVCGPRNAGKSKLVTSELKLKHGLESDVVALHIQMTPKVTARQLQCLIKTRLEAVSSFCLAPPPGKILTIFIDDINLKSASEEMSASFSEFLRYIMEYSMWYDADKRTPFAILDMEIIATMCMEASLHEIHSSISTRLQRRFSLIHLPKPDEFQLRKIFTRLANGKLEEFAPAVKLLADEITIATLEIGKLIFVEYGSQDSHPFHIFNLHDISRVYEGLFRAHKESQDTKFGFLRLWFYECTRVFHDRLSEPTSRNTCLDILEKQLAKHFEMTPASLFPPRLNGDDEHVPLFGNFLKGARCFEEIKNVVFAHKTIKDTLQTVIKVMRPVVLFKEAVTQVVRIARVLSQQKGHLIICGENGQGRETLIRTAALLYDYKVFQMPINTGDGNHDKHYWKLMKAAFKTCVEENIGCCVFLKDEQITERILDWVSIATSTVEIPELFTKKEVSEIFKRCKSNQPKWDTAAVDIMSWFKGKVEKNLHIVLCVEPSHKEFFDHVRGNYSDLMKTMTVNWFEIWTQKSYLEVACTLLKGDDNLQKIPSSSPSSAIFYSIHSIVIGESTAVTPMHFVDFLEFYKWYLKSAKDEYSRQMRMFKNAIQEIIDVRSKIGTLTEQAESAERKAEASRQECARMLAIIRQQESDVKSQEAIVNEKNGQLEEEIKEYEQLASVIKGEWSEALGDFEKETEVLQDLADEDLIHIRSYFSPPPLVSKVLDAVMIMLDKEQNWPEAKIQLGYPGFIKNILEYDKARITLEKLNSLKKFLQNKEFTPEAVSKHSNGARILCAWIHAIEKYGRCYLSKICPKREKLENSEQSILDNKHTLLLASEKLQLLRENVTEIETIYETKVNLKESLEEDAKQCSDILGRAASVLRLLEQENDSGHNNHVQKWKDNLVQLDTKINELEGNALLCSAYLAYAGFFNGDVRRKLKEKWKQEIESLLGVKFKEEWTLEDALDFEKIVDVRERIHICLKGFYSSKYQDVLESEWHLENVILVKKSRRPTLCLAPYYGIQKINGNGGITVEGRLVKNRLIELYSTREQNNTKENVFITKDISQAEIDRKVSSRFSLVNCTLSSQGLKNYFMLKITKLINPEEESRRKTLVHSALAEKIRISDFAEKIPKLVISCGGASILNNGEFPETLSNWQDEVHQSEKNLEDMEKEIADIESTRYMFLYGAASFTRLFESINEMSSDSNYYRMSLEFFTSLLEKMFRQEFSQKRESSAGELESAPDSSRQKLVEKMIEFLEDDVTLGLFKIAVRCMLKHHRYQFSLLLSIKTLLDESGEIEKREMLKEEVSILMSAPVPQNDYCNTEDVSGSVNEPNWLNSHQMNALDRLDKLKSFRGLRESIYNSETNLWRNWISNYSSDEIPGKWNSKLSVFEKLVLVSILRSDLVPQMVLSLTTEVLGEKYFNFLTSCDLLDIKEIYNDNLPESGSLSTLSTIPVIFLVDSSPVVTPAIPDPQPSVWALANSLRPPQKLYTLTVSESNKDLALNLIEECSKKGYWAYLAHCKMHEQWFWEVEKILKNSLSNRNNFKLWMCTKLESTDFPKDIVWNSIRVAVEAPSTLNLSVARLQKKMANSSVNESSSEQCRQLFHALCYFQCQLQQKANFQKHIQDINEKIPVLQDLDFEVSLSILKQFAHKYLSEEDGLAYTRFPWWALKYMLELQYGSHIADEKSHKIIRDLLNKAFNADAIHLEVLGDEKVACVNNTADISEIYELPPNLRSLLCIHEAKLILHEAFSFQNVLISLINSIQ